MLKKGIIWTVAAALAVLLVFPQGKANAADSGPAGMPVGYVYSTDIVAYIDGTPIDSYNIGGRTAVACDDLGTLGFQVIRDFDAGILEVWTGKVRTDVPTRLAQSSRPGEIVGSVKTSGTRIRVNGLGVPGYEIDGKVVVVIEDLGVPNRPGTPPQEHVVSDYMFSCVWDPGARTISLFSLFSIAESPYEPISVVYDSIDHTSVGLDGADSVYEWFRPNDAPQGLAVFTGADWEAGPLGDLSVGAAYIGLMYGRVACSDVMPETEEYLSKRKIALPVHATNSHYVTAEDALGGFAAEQEQPFNTADSPFWRGHLDPDAPAAATVTGVLPDGTEAFSWRWNGEVYERDIGSTTVTASAIVLMEIDESTGFGDTGLFPNGLLAGQDYRAFIFGEGRMVSALWRRYATMWTSLGFEYPGGSRGPSPIRLPLGTVWFEILTAGCTYSYK